MGISQAIPDENCSWAFVIGIPYWTSRLEFPMGIGYWISVEEFNVLITNISDRTGYLMINDGQHGGGDAVAMRRRRGGGADINKQHRTSLHLHSEKEKYHRLSVL